MNPEHLTPETLALLRGKGIKEQSNAIISSRRVGQVALPRTTTGATSETWSDRRFLEILRTYRYPKLDNMVMCRTVAIEFLRFLLTGKHGISSSMKLLEMFVCSFEWFSQPYSDSVYPIQKVLERAGLEPEVLSLPNETSLTDLETEFKNRMTLHSTQNAMGLTLAGPGSNPQEQVSASLITHMLKLGQTSLVQETSENLILMVRQYYSAIVRYYGDRSTTTNQMSDFSHISLIRSMYVMALILCRCRSKDPRNVIRYISDGSYKRLAASLVVETADLVYEISPITDSLSNLCQNLNTTSAGPSRIACFLIATYCGLRDGLSQDHIVTSMGDLPSEIKNPLAPEISNPAYLSFTNLLEGGCLLHLRYKGLPIIRLIEEISRKVGLDTCSTTDKLSTTITQGTCVSIMMIVQTYSAYWAKQQNKVIFHPAETSWRYAKNISDNVFLEMSNKDNVQFHYRVASVLAKTTEMDISRIASISSYRPTPADSTYVEKVGARLFGSSWTEVEVSILEPSENPPSGPSTTGFMISSQQPRGTSEE